MVSLALAVSQKLVAGLPISAEMVEAAVRDALAQVEGAARFTVRLHQADLELLQKAGSPLLTPAAGQEFRFLASPGRHPGRLPGGDQFRHGGRAARNQI